MENYLEIKHQPISYKRRIKYWIFNYFVLVITSFFAGLIHPKVDIFLILLFFSTFFLIYSFYKLQKSSLFISDIISDSKNISIRYFKKEGSN